MDPPQSADEPSAEAEPEETLVPPPKTKPGLARQLTKTVGFSQQRKGSVRGSVFGSRSCSPSKASASPMEADPAAASVTQGEARREARPWAANQGAGSCDSIDASGRCRDEPLDA